MKNKNLIVRLDERDSIKLDEICKYFECTRSDYIRYVIYTQFKFLKDQYIIKEEP